MNYHKKELISYMNKFVKSGLFLSVFGALSGVSNLSNAAKYEVEFIANVVDSENSPLYENSYAVGINNNGHTVSAVTDFYNFPIRFELLTFEDFLTIIINSQNASLLTYGLTAFNDIDASFSEEDSEQLIEDFRAGNLNGNDQAWIRLYLQSNSFGLIQSIGTNVVLNNGTPNKIDLWDEVILDSTELSHSTQDIVTGITDNNWIYGQASAPLLPQESKTVSVRNLISTSPLAGQTYTTTIDAWIREFDQQAYISADGGNTLVTLKGPATLFGGYSRIEDIDGDVNSDSFFAVGSASVGYNSSFLEAIESCGTSAIDNGVVVDITNNISATSDENAIARVLYPEFCTQFYRNFVDSLSGARLYDIDAYLWELNANAEVISQRPLGKLITPHPFDARAHTSVATAINNKGVAVGYSPDWALTQPFNINTESAASIAATSPVLNNAIIFKDEEVIDITGEEYQRFESKAFDINDNGIVVGYVSTLFTGVQKRRFFYYDSTSNEAELVLPDALFSGGASEARAVNNNGIIVGDTEFERHLDSGGATKPRRRHGFIYDMNTDEFYDANHLLTCVDRAKYEIIQVSDISDNGEIVATAYVNKDRKDAIGELELDENGNVLTENVLQAIKLKPVIGGQIEVCSDLDDANLIKRQGAGTSWLLLLLSGIFMLRRR